MPTYTYVCKKCKSKFDHFQSINSKKLEKCRKKECNGSLQRLIGPGSGIIFKGQGWTPKYH